MSTRRKLMTVLTTAMATAALITGEAKAADNQVLVDFYVLDKSGAPVRLSVGDGRKVIHHTSAKDPGDERWSEVLLDPDTLEALPGEENQVRLTNDGSGHLRLAFTARKLRSGKGPALALAWPTGKGYSYVIMDNGGKGYAQAPSKPVVFNYQAAKDIDSHLRARVAAVPGYKPPAAYTNALAQATSELGKVGNSLSPPVQGRHGERALSALHTAYDAFTADYGPRVARQRMATAPPGQDARPWLGTTIVESSSVPFYDKVWRRMVAATTPLGKQAGYGWVRIVFELDNGTTVDFSKYDTAIRNAHKAGLRVMGEITDSSAAAELTTPQYVTRTRNLLEHYGRSADPELRIDAWEVGNEVNGCWVDNKNCGAPVRPGDRIHVKAGAAAREVKQNSPSTPVVLTLFWEFGAGEPSAKPWMYSPFNWIAPGSGNLKWTDRDGVERDLLADVDVVLLSIFTDNAPLGISIDRVMSTLDRRVSELATMSKKQVRVGIGELGYWCGSDGRRAASVYEWCADMNRVWPMGALDNASIAAAQSYMVNQYTRAALATDHGIGGGFYWYALQEMFPRNTETSLCAALKEVTDAVGPKPANQSDTAAPGKPC
ncbi:hypothetical protein LWC34_04990 [Kibdelosporangium philippinense]|uniref:Cellulase (Glycosyl hydrolase family 5) n=1 Tax=Kibdelosporangium philippinense TaxID=211113 RepID=A0ABS8Z5A7_9PSEU|nr:hypothetical protein [Kibdelosporangium philippinense]MCE7002184.1 hypothetical protein [Kibdelosporangium philippinense]